MKVCRKNTARRIYALAVLALAFTEKLLPPFDKRTEIRVIRHKNFNALARIQHMCTRHGIAVCGIVFRIGKKLFFFRLCAVKHFPDIAARSGKRKQSHCRKHRESAADIIGDDKRFISVLFCKRQQCALFAVCCRKNTVLQLLRTVTAFHVFSDEAERDSRLGCRAGLGDNVYADALTLAETENIRDLLTRKRISEEIYLRSALSAAVGAVVIRGTQEIQRRLCAEIAAANTDHD